MDLQTPQNRFSLLRARWFPLSAQVVAFIVFVLLVLGGWGVTTSDAKLMLHLRNTNLANVVVWSFWFPAMIAAAVVLGRVWCMVCPMELLSNVLNRVGFKLRPPSFLRTGWGITALYAAVLVIGVHTFSIHRVPHHMALYMLVLLGLTALASLVFEKRAFCSYVCPVGHLLGLYAHNAVLEWRVKAKEVCQGCREKPCIAVKRDHLWHGRPCTSRLYPGKLTHNRDCLLCTQCYKACDKDNVAFRFRRPFADFLQPLPVTPAIAAFVLILFGFVFYEVVTEWKTSKKLLLALPDALNRLSGMPTPWDGTLTAVVLFCAAPLALFLLAAAVQSLASSGRLRPMHFVPYLMGFIPLLGAGHLAKSFLKATPRLQHIPSALADPKGIDTAKAILAGSASTPAWQANLSTAASVVSMPVVLVGLGASLVILGRIARHRGERWPAAYWALTVAYALCLLAVLVGKVAS